MDVHPPLAKMLIPVAGWLAGFNGDFDFKDIGKDYVEPGVPYVAMRLLPALCGVATIPTMFLTLKATGCRTTTAALGAALVIFGMRTIGSPCSTPTDSYRQRSSDPIPSYPPRFSTHHLYRGDGSSFHEFHQPTRTGPFKSVSAIMVVLASSYRRWSWSYCERKMGWSFHNRLGWELDYPPTLGLARRHEERYSSKSSKSLHCRGC